MSKEKPLKKESELQKKLKELEAALEEEKKKSDELRDTAQRVQAEFENFSKRMEKEKEEFKKFSAGAVVADFLAVLDSFDDGIKSMQKHGSVSKEEYIKGLELLKKQFFSVLQKHGLSEMHCVGKKFDPHFHECMLKEHDEKKEDEIVLEEFQKGYLLHDKVLRTSKVKINKLEEKKNE